MVRVEGSGVCCVKGVKGDPLAVVVLLLVFCGVVRELGLSILNSSSCVDQSYTAYDEVAGIAAPDNYQLHTCWIFYRL